MRKHRSQIPINGDVQPEFSQWEKVELPSLNPAKEGPSPVDGEK
jgi:hypothetical protein